MRDILAIEVTAAAIRALRLGGIGPARAIRSYAECPLPPGVVVPSASLPNVRDEATFARALADAVGSHPPRRARLVLPDRSVRLHVLATDAIPSGGPDVRRFLVWRLQDALPFEPREARVAYLPAPNGLPGRQVAVTLVAREPVLVQYERLLGGAGTTAAHVAPPVCHLFNLAAQDREVAGTPPVHAFLALGPESAALILSRRGIPEYARTFLRPGAEAEAPLLDRDGYQAIPPVQQRPTRHKELVSELLRTFEHAQEEARLEPPARLFLGGELGQDARLAATLEEELAISCALLPFPPPRVHGAGRLPPEAHAVLSAAIAPL